MLVLEKEWWIDGKCDWVCDILKRVWIFCWSKSESKGSNIRSAFSLGKVLSASSRLGKVLFHELVSSYYLIINGPQSQLSNGFISLSLSLSLSFCLSSFSSFSAFDYWWGSQLYLNCSKRWNKTLQDSMIIATTRSGSRKSSFTWSWDSKEFVISSLLSSQIVTDSSSSSVNFTKLSGNSTLLKSLSA